MAPKRRFRASFEAILARLDISKQLPGQPDLDVALRGDGGRHVEHVRRAVHTKPFGPSRSSGSFFQSSGRRLRGLQAP